jgi:two-component system sensor histidine kinase RegB
MSIFLGSAMRQTNLLPRLFVLRWIEVACQILVLWGAQRWLTLQEGQWQLLASLVGLLAGINLFTWWRLSRSWPVTDPELFAQISADVLVLGALLYFSGGSTNPFVSLFLLPLTIAAAILPSAYAWAMAALTLAGYTFLLFVNVPLPPQSLELPFLDTFLAPAPGAEHAGHVGHGAHGDHGGHSAMSGPDSGFALHILGMWFNFVVSAGIIAFFLARLAATLRGRDRELAAAREEALRNEQILALGTLAAGAAHQLGTPLSTMAVVIRELELHHDDEGELREDLGMLRRQVDNCKELLSQLLKSAGRTRAESTAAHPLDTYLQEIAEKWRLLCPLTPLLTDWRGALPAPLILAEQTLEQALLNLLDNAADASPTEIQMTAHWSKSECLIEILDRGPGVAGSVAQKIGQPFFTTKRDQGGVGIGLFLSNATLERLGGKVELFNRPGGGACTRITLPLKRLQIAGVL